MKISMVVNMDSQGRVVIPTNIRKTLQLPSGGMFEIETNGMDIRLRKCPEVNPYKELAMEFLDILYSVVPFAAMICTKDDVIASKGIYLPSGTPISEDLSTHVLWKTDYVLEQITKIQAVDNLPDHVAAIFPITHQNPDMPDMALVLFRKRNKSLNEMQVGSAKLVAVALGNKYTASEKDR